ncbi:MAG TPA: hypothetical protein VIM58_05060 [Candidatus Methylacidiphilales bacterium]
MSPRSFVLRLALAFAVFVAFWVGLFALQMGVVTPFAYHLGLLVGAKREIAVHQTSPKTVLLGPSNVLYGLHAESLERLTGRPAANFGLILGFSPDYLARLVLDTEGVLRPGDTLVLALAYEQYQDAYFRDDTLMEYALAHDPAYFYGLPFPEQVRWVFGLHERRIKYAAMIRCGIRVKDRHLGVDETLTPWGDLTSNVPANQSPQEKASIFARRIPDHARMLPSDTLVWPVLLRLRDACAARGVALRIAFPPYYLPGTPQEEARLDRFFAALVDFYDRNGFVRLGTPWEALLPRDRFFNSEYHPFYDAAEERTAVLAAELLASGPGKR